MAWDAGNRYEAVICQSGQRYQGGRGRGGEGARRA